MLFPGALGDFLCCWPTIAALRTAEPVTLAARPEWMAVLPEGAVVPMSIDDRAVADLFAEGPLRAETRARLAGFTRVESWTGHGDARFAARLAEATGAQVAVHPFRAFRPGEHAVEYYARCAGVGATITALPVRPAAAEWAARWWAAHRLGDTVLAIHPGSGSARKNWEGMGAVAAAWRAEGGQVVAMLGPAEAERGAALDGDAVLAGEPLDRVAAVLARAAGYLGNDSGISHLAGLVGARGVALFGPTDPVAWRPRGAGIRVLHAPAPCATCGPERFCVHRLPVATVLDALT